MDHVTGFDELRRFTVEADHFIPVYGSPECLEVLERMFIYGVDLRAMLPAYSLHAALLAKSRGHQGFAMTPIVGQDIVLATFITGNKGDPGLKAPLFNDADAVIVQLSPVIPSPEMIKAEARAKTAK